MIRCCEERVRRLRGCAKWGELLGARWFRLGVCVSYFLALSLLLATERLWRATPSGVRPEVWISIWDAAQAWRWQRAAKRHEAAERLENALFSWRMAVDKRPSAEALRGLLRIQAAQEPQDGNRRSVGRDCFWLLRLTQTNLADLELVSRTFNRYELGRWTLSVLDKYPGALPDALEKEYLRALFLQGRVEEFARQWERIEGKQSDDGEMRLFRAAYLAGWGAPEKAAENLAFLEAAKKERETEILAHRLSLFVDYVRLDADGYGRSLHFLTRRKADLLSCRVNYWNLLAGTGQKRKAFWLATRYFQRSDSNRPPDSTMERATVAESFMNMGRESHAFWCLRRPADGLDHGFMEDWRQSKADALMINKQWSELGELALSLRRDCRMGEGMMGYSFFLEGVSEMERGRADAAKKAFQKISDYSLGEGERGLFMASHLVRLQFYAAARDVLLGLRSKHKDKTVFWRLLFVAAKEIGDSRGLLSATENLHHLRPHDRETRNDYLAVLLSLRIRPDAAMSLTYQGMRQNPHDAAGKIHRARALLWNEKADAAASLLVSINPKRLIGTLEQSFYLARLELEFQRKRVQEAYKWSGKIRPKLLIPGDRRRFQEIGDRLAVMSVESGVAFHKLSILQKSPRKEETITDKRRQMFF